MIDLAVFISQADHCVTSECVEFAHLSAGIWVFIEKKINFKYELSFQYTVKNYRNSITVITVNS